MGRARITTGPVRRSSWTRERAVTQRTNRFDLFGPIAERLLHEGRVAEAELALADHMHRLLDSAKKAEAVPQRLCDLAGRYALMLAASTESGKWVDYAVELHLRARHVLCAGVVNELERIQEDVDWDLELFRNYVDVLRAMRAAMTRTELEVVNRLARIELHRLYSKSFAKTAAG
jgi:hypothetical protein